MGSRHDDQAEQHVVLATYRVAEGDEHERAFTAILRNHWPSLHRLGFVTDEPARIYRQRGPDGRVTFVEIFTWRPGAVGKAHQHPEVLAIWEPMEQHLAEHDGRPKMEFPHFAPWSADA